MGYVCFRGKHQPRRTRQTKPSSEKGRLRQVIKSRSEAIFQVPVPFELWPKHDPEALHVRYGCGHTWVGCDRGCGCGSGHGVWGMGMGIGYRVYVGACCVFVRGSPEATEASLAGATTRPELPHSAQQRGARHVHGLAGADRGARNTGSHIGAALPPALSFLLPMKVELHPDAENRLQVPCRWTLSVVLAGESDVSSIKKRSGAELCSSPPLLRLPLRRHILTRLSSHTCLLPHLHPAHDGPVN